MKYIFIILVPILFVLSSCAGPVRQVGVNSSSDGKQAIYLVNYETADTACLQSMMAAFPDIPFERASFPKPYIRYQANMRIALDHHTVVVTAIPHFVENGKSQDVYGYSFEVSDHGSIIIQGPQRAGALASHLTASLSGFSKRER